LGDGGESGECGVMQFLGDYMKAIDLLALVAVVGIGAATLSRTGFVPLFCAAVVVAVWGATRIFGFP
jgi:hypothetical protein